jgi:hypothetical protein
MHPASFFRRFKMPQARRSSRLLAIPLVLAGLFLSSLACVGNPFQAPTITPTATPTASSTPTSTATPTATETPTVTLSLTYTITPTMSYLDWPVVFSEDFEYDNGSWDTGKDSDENITTDVSITGGKYLVKISSQNPLFWWTRVEVVTLKDFFLSAEVKKIQSPEKTDYGVIFHESAKGYYYFFINAPAKQYSVFGYFDGKWRAIIYWRDSELIDPIGSNQLAVLAQGSQYTLFLNRREVDSFEDDMLDKGKIGVGLQLYKAGDYIQLEFDNFLVTAPK